MKYRDFIVVKFFIKNIHFDRYTILSSFILFLIQPISPAR